MPTALNVMMRRRYKSQGARNRESETRIACDMPEGLFIRRKYESHRPPPAQPDTKSLVMSES